LSLLERFARVYKKASCPHLWFPPTPEMEIADELLTRDVKFTDLGPMATVSFSHDPGPYGLEWGPFLEGFSRGTTVEISGVWSIDAPEPSSYTREVERGR
jgi:hypothetical protein